MASTQTIDAFALMAQVGEYAQDPVFLCRLKALISSHEANLAKQARCATYALRLRAAPQTDRHVRALLALLGRANLRYGETEMVPDPYQDLEDHGLVYCQHGPRNDRGLDVRTITLTPAGLSLAEMIREAHSAAAAA